MPDQQTPQKIKDFFSGYPLPSKEITDMVQMGLTPTRKEMAHLIMMSFATAREQVETWSDFYLDDDSSTVMKKAAVTTQEMLNGVFTSLSSQSDLNLDGRTVLQWAEGEGREPTMDDVNTLLALLMWIEKAMGPITDMLLDFSCPEVDDYSKGIWSFVAYKHWLLRSIEECDCSMSNRMLDEGVDFSGIPNQYGEFEDRIREGAENDERAEAAMVDGDDFGDEISDQTKDMVEQIQFSKN